MPICAIYGQPFRPSLEDRVAASRKYTIARPQEWMRFNQSLVGWPPNKPEAKCKA